MFSLRKNVFFMLRFRSTHLWKILIILGRLVWFLSFKLGRGQKEIFRRSKVCVCCWWDPERNWIDFVKEVLHAVFSRKKINQTLENILMLCIVLMSRDEEMQILRPNSVGSSEDCPEMNGLDCCQSLLEERLSSHEGAKWSSYI